MPKPGATISTLAALLVCVCSGCSTYLIEGSIPERLDVRHRVQEELVLEQIEVAVRTEVEMRVELRNRSTKEALRVDWYATFEGPMEMEEAVDGQVVRYKTTRPQTGRTGMVELAPLERRTLEVNVPWVYSAFYQFGVKQVERIDPVELTPAE